ncbi:hypothetical protein D9M72_581810 [compost metagenome]
MASVPCGSTATDGMFRERSVVTSREPRCGASRMTPASWLTEDCRSLRQLSGVACSARVQASVKPCRAAASSAPARICSIQGLSKLLTTNCRSPGTWEAAVRLL